MNTMTDHLLPRAEAMQEHFSLGVRDWQDGERRLVRSFALDAYAAIRAKYGFAEIAADLLTEPSANEKLSKGAKRPAYGLTLQHHSVKLTSGLRVNLCPWAGHCTKVCVLDNGNGAYPAVQRARLAKTQFLHSFPEWFAYLLGWELARAAAKFPDQGIDFRPNVNSDVEWERILPSMLDGSLLPNVWCYGYTKNQAILDGDGWVLPRYRIAFSASERLGIENQRLWSFVYSGGVVAVVTNRTKKRDVEQWAPSALVVNADLTDEWIWKSGVIGDLSAKGKARGLIGKSGFVACPYSQV
jgi:hypothetical protein